MKVVLYKAEYCPYCSEVYEKIKQLREKYNFELEVYEYTENPEAFKDIEYVPTIFVNGKKVTIDELEHELLK
jgi:glutaredoxin